MKVKYEVNLQLESTNKGGFWDPVNYYLGL